MRPYAIGDPDLEHKIEELVQAAGVDRENNDLIAEIVTTALKLHRDAADRGDLKLLNTALKEMRYSMLVFSRHREMPKVTIFGSARTTSDDPNYQLTVDFARIMADRSWGVITGAGPGIMQAGNEGAGLDASFGVNIRLPFESDANPHIENDRVINFKYFFTRKLGFVKESHAFALFPGGFGTMDETFELLTLIQTGKSDLHPIVLLETENSTYWEDWQRFVEENLVRNGMVSPEDLNLYKITSDPVQAADEICRFYANYQSQRYVKGTLILRLNQAPDEVELAKLNSEFADILVDGEMAVIPATEAEVAENDSLDADRLALHFDQRSFGRLRKLLDALNDLVETSPREIQLPPPYRDELPERPW
ncbi:MAG: TIGR00730 family Rossman fold protein [Acidimicrobiia bacterium]|nr:TIGR00730 family Rossman fold protein [Acidimicrobiia bacterium]